MKHNTGNCPRPLGDEWTGDKCLAGPLDPFKERAMLRTIVVIICEFVESRFWSLLRSDWANRA